MGDYMVRICIIDNIGLTYDGNTLSSRGLGGSESAVILMSKELVSLGFDVTVINNCIDRESKPGVYDGVLYKDHSQIQDEVFDIAISSRTVIPFLPEHLYDQFQEFNPSIYKKIKENAKLKIVWMHDTFCRGDHLLEDMLTHGDIDEIFTLSDFHTSYVSNCDHGKKRMFEILKKHIFMTRNGVVNYKEDVDISKKDPNLFVYNASVTKGMVPLVEKIWPKIKKSIPEAKLKVIGGYYRFRENAEPDEQEKVWRKMAFSPNYNVLGIEFTGIIKQEEIAEILSNASFMLYPGAFPETFGISTLESLLYNTPLITTRFGALEETAIESACYLIDYPIEPNSLFQDINRESQEDKFVELIIKAYNDKYLLQQKMYACNIVKDICSWDTIALQWKQHFYRVLGLYLSKEEYNKVSHINTSIHKVFNRRFSNPEEWCEMKFFEQKIIVITPFYNAEKYIEKCILSVASQNYSNYLHILIDDCSTDDSYEKAGKVIYNLPEEIMCKFILKRKIKNNGALKNQVDSIRLCDKEDIIILLDGDDSLNNNNDIFDFYNNLYDGSTEFSYGSCWSMVDNIPLIAQPYPESVKKSKTYRNHKFNWNIPYTHLRTFKASLLPYEKFDDQYKNEWGEWFKAGGDAALFYALIEKADPNLIKVVQDIMCLYNDASPLNDYKVNGEEQTMNAIKILEKPKVDLSVAEVPDKPPKTILIAIPTAKYIEPETFKSIYDLEIPKGYKVTFQYFFGYQIDQVRNLIADWSRRFDYLFCVDSDITFPSDTLRELLIADKDIVTGVYKQRFHGEPVLELWKNNLRMEWADLKDTYEYIELDSCGFGCVLIKSHVIKHMDYPHFVYKSAIDHKDTLSEDVYFCTKAREKGFKIYVDPTVICGHLGSCSYDL
jgi:glycosyltransferase involved in cell wall biosynthesis